MTKMDVLVPGNNLSFAGGFFGFSAVVLLRHPELGPILFDTGHHSTRHLLLQGLDRVGLAPGDIEHVFLSHLHFDHINNVDIFPNAQFYIPRLEWDYAKAPDPRDVFGSEPICDWLERRNLRMIGREGELAPGLFYRHAPGHTAGMTLLHFQDCAGHQVVVAGDACKTYRELVTGDAGEAFDPEERSAETLRWIRETADIIVCGHHPVLHRNGANWTWDEPSHLELIVR